MTYRHSALSQVGISGEDGISSKLQSEGLEIFYAFLTVYTYTFHLNSILHISHQLMVSKCVVSFGLLDKILIFIDFCCHLNSVEVKEIEYVSKSVYCV